MFKRYELEKLVYVHPTFLSFWYGKDANPYGLIRHLLQSQLVNHVLKEIGLVVIVNQVVSVKSGKFDPVDGGIYATVRFICYAFAPVPRSILKGKVERIDSEGLVVGGFGLPNVKIPLNRLRTGTVFNGENKSFVWTKILEGGNAKYFETKHGDDVRYQVDSVIYDKHKQIILYDSNAASGSHAIEIIGDLRTWSLGPIHWYTSPHSFEKDSDKSLVNQVEASAALLNKNQPDYLAFLKGLI